MAITNSTNVHDEFFNVFLSGTTEKAIPGDSVGVHFMLPIAGKDYLIRHFNRGGDKNVDKRGVYYPCIIIQEMAPVPDQNFAYGKDWVEGIADTINEEIEILYLPILMDFKYQVSLVTKNFVDKQHGFDWFMQNFSVSQTGFFEFNKYETPEGSVCDPVQYKITGTEVPREDGKYEYVFDYSLKTFVHFRQSVKKDYLAALNIELQQGDTNSLQKVLQKQIQLLIN